MGEDLEPTASGRPAKEARVGSLATLAAGTRVGKYEIVSTLGQGGFGITYRARDTELDRDVALKEYMPIALALREPDQSVLPRAVDLTDDFRHGRDRFFEEARTLAHLSGTPGIVGVHDYLAANNTAYMAMALIHGETLEARLKRDHRLQQPALEQLLYRLLDGLEIVHRTGFLHRDIKPANILIDTSGHATLVDFGSSRAAVMARTQTMTAVYTPGYSAPEQMTSGKQGPWTDIYALAATLYHCVSGRPPPGAMERLTGDPWIPAAEIATTRYAPTLLAAIDAGLRLKPAERPQSIEEWRHVLDGTAAARAIEADAITRALDAPASREIARASRRKRWPLVPIAAGIAALVIAAGGAWMVMQPALETPEQMVVRLETEARRLTEQATKLRQAEEARQQAASEARRKADEEVARRAEDEKAATETAARQQTEEAERQRAAAVEAHRKAEEEAARRAAEEKAAGEAVAKRKTEEEAAERAAADASRRRAEEQARAEADARRKVEEATSRKAAEEKAKADAEAKRQAEAAEAAARKAAEDKAKADADAKRQAETAEAALNLPEPDRKRVQIALTSLGHDTRGSDGVFGPRTRQMIAAWQKSQSAPETGYLTPEQLAALRQQTAPALARYDEEQKKQDEEAKKRAEEAQRGQPPATAPTPVATVPSATSPASDVDGVWTGTLACTLAGPQASVSIPIAGGSGRGSFKSAAGPGEVSLRITGSNVFGEFSWLGQGATLRGSVSGQSLTAGGGTRSGAAGSSIVWCTVALHRQPATAAVSPARLTTASGRARYIASVQCRQLGLRRRHRKKSRSKSAAARGGRCS